MLDFSALSNWLAIRALPIVLGFLFALIIAYFSRRMTRRMLYFSRYAPTQEITEERRQTLLGVIAGAITFSAFVLASLFCMAQFVDISTLVWIIGLFSAAFGLGFRPLISDLMTGLSFIFEDTLDVGEKVDILGIEGIVEDVNLRTIHLRGMSGELNIIPNGEIRVIRNYSRGKFSRSDMSFKIYTKDLETVIALLLSLDTDAMQYLPNLIEPWQVLSEEVVGQKIEIKILAKARYGKAAEMRPRLQAYVQEQLALAEIELAE